MTPETRQRLLQEGIDPLVELLLADTLATPVRELVDLPGFSRTVADALRSAADDPTVARMVHDRLRDARARAGSGPIPLPKELQAPLHALVGRVFIPDRTLMGALLEHEGARVLLRGLFEDLLVSFAEKLKPPVPIAAPRGLPNLGRLGQLGQGVLGAVGQEFERQIKTKAAEFMVVAVHKLTGRLADQFCDPTAAPVYAEWRIHAVDTLLRTDRAVLAGEVDKLDPDALADSALELVRAFVARDGLETEVQRVLTAVVDELGDQSLRDALGGVEAHGIAIARDLLRARLRAVVATDAFAVWWDRMAGA